MTGCRVGKIKMTQSQMHSVWREHFPTIPLGMMLQYIKMVFGAKIYILHGDGSVDFIRQPCQSPPNVIL